jgi:hypothetical protein
VEFAERRRRGSKALAQANPAHWPAKTDIEDAQRRFALLSFSRWASSAFTGNAFSAGFEADSDRSAASTATEFRQRG